MGTQAASFEGQTIQWQKRTIYNIYNGLQSIIQDN
jgi:hypothetical protein